MSETKEKYDISREDGICQSALRFLDMDFVKNFSSSTCGSDRVRACYDVMKNNGLFQNVEWSNSVKNEQRALKARTKGNASFVNGDYCAALEAYNESLCFTLPGSENMAIVYANRSAVYLNSGFYKFSLENIELALENGYPEDLKPKLMERKAECLKLQETEQDSFDVYTFAEKPALSYPENSRVPFTIDGIKLAVNKKYGRHIVATRDLKPGDIIAVEDTMSNWLQKNAVYSQCVNCVNHNFFNLKPCSKSAMTMFCSEKCSKTAWNRFHQFEYQIKDKLYNISPQVYLAIRTCFLAFTMFDNPKYLKSFIASINVKNDNAFTVDWTTQNVEKAKFRAFYTLKNPQDNSVKNEDHLVQRCTGAMKCAIGFEIVKKNSSFSRILKKRNTEDMFLDLLMHFYAIFWNGSLGISNSLRKNPEHPNKFINCEMACGIAPLFSLFNHSCAPNVGPMNYTGNNAGILVLRPIKAGEQLFTKYGINHHTLRSLELRKKILSERYGFDCTCEACVKNYPLSEDLEVKDIMPTELQKKLKEFLENDDYDDYGRQLAGELKEPILKLLIEKSTEYYPCLELTIMLQGLYKIHDYEVFIKPMEHILARKQ